MNTSWVKGIGLILLGYLCGSVSFAYLWGRVGRAIDLRDYGSRKLSGSNIYHFFGVMGMVLVGILDVSKAVLPVWLSIRLGCRSGITVLVGLAAMAGHNWSCFLGLRGGRGISMALGLLFCIFPWGALWILVWLAVGRLVPREAAVPALLGLLGLPLFALLLHQPLATIWAGWGILLLTIAKRLEANGLALPADEPAWRVLWRRLLLDRDLADFDVWIAHEPDMSA